MAFDFSTLITDRSPDDLQALRNLLATPMADWTAEQLSEFNRAVSKGAYNYTDLNRVTACMDYLNEVLTGLGYETGYAPVEVPHRGGGRLPEGYTEREYIESSGTQYIDTGFKPNQDTRVVVDVYITEQHISSNCVFGTRSAASSTAPLMLNLWSMNTGTAVRFDYFGGNTTSSTSLVGKRSLVDANKNICTIGDTVLNGTYQQGQTKLNLFVLTCNNAGNFNSKYNTYARLYSCQIYDNGTLIRDYVPCTNPSGEVGLYDLENEEFYGNAGSGAFTAGPEAAPLPDPSKDSYTWYEEDLPTSPLMAAYLANVTALRGVLTLGENTPAVPSDMAGLTLTEANAIEQILDAINDYLGAMQAVFLRSGMAWAISGGPNFYFQN